MFMNSFLLVFLLVNLRMACANPEVSGPHLTALESHQIRADRRIRTADRLITNQLLWPTELYRHLLCNERFKAVAKVY